MSFQENLTFLSLLLRGAHDEAANRLKCGAVQPADFLQFALRHHLQLMILPMLDGAVRQEFPEDCIRQLKTVCRRQWAMQEALIHELGHLAQVFTTANQEFILLKGPYLGERFFGSADLRVFSDLDILVRKRRLAEIENLLRRDGYLRKSGVLLNAELTTQFTHAFDFVKRNMTLDLHWRLSAQSSHDLDEERIWQSQRFVLRGQSFLVLSDEYEVVFNLISIFKDLERGAAHLKPFVDLYFVLGAVARNMDWDGFLDRRKGERILRISLNILALFFELFDCRERFPELAAAVDRHRKSVKSTSPRFRGLLIEASPGDLRNKVWAAGLYDCSRLRVFLWWLISLPFRLAVHEPGRWDHGKRRIRIWAERSRARLGFW